MYDCMRHVLETFISHSHSEYFSNAVVLEDIIPHFEMSLDGLLFSLLIDGIL